MALVLKENGFHYHLQIADDLKPFRLAECVEYQRLSKLGFKEVEAGWLKANASGHETLFLLEMKAWYDQDPNTGAEYYDAEPTDMLTYAEAKLASKIIDVVYMLAQARPLINVQRCVDATILTHLKEGKPMVCVFLIKAKTNQPFTALKIAIAEKLRKSFAGYNLDFHIPQKQIFIFNHDEFRDFYAESFGLTPLT